MKKGQHSERWFRRGLRVAVGLVLVAPGCVIVSAPRDAGSPVDRVASDAAPQGVDRPADAGASEPDAVAPLDAGHDTPDGGSLEDGALEDRDVARADVTQGDAARPSEDAGAPAFAGLGAELEGWLDVYRRGGTNDYDRDGRVDTTVTVDAQGVTTVIVHGPRGPRVRTVLRSVVDYDESVDDNADGVFDITRTSRRLSGHVTTVETRDFDFDGTPNLRVTQTANISTREDFLPGADGGPPRWTVTRSSVGVGEFYTGVPECVPPRPVRAETQATVMLPSAGACSETGCNHRCLVPDVATLEASSIRGFTSLPSQGVRILTRGATPATCTPEQVHRLNVGFAALSADLERIRAINPDLHHQVLVRLSRVTVYVGCAVPPCVPSDVSAWTEGPRNGTWGDTPTATIYLRPGGALDIADAAVRGPAVRELLLHELMHLYTSHEDRDSGFQGRDLVYACARYAVRWEAGLRYYLGRREDASSARDAAVCASMDHKPQFGRGRATLRTSRFFIEHAPGAALDVPMCSTTPDDPPTEAPLCAAIEYATYCDQTPVTPSLRTFMDLHQGACTTLCPETAPVQLNTCSLRPNYHIDEIYDRVAGCTQRVGAAEY
ncbi:MAG: hypothetical protein JNK72_11215 [Myxococcales bacterium]|nr:hypothetical protein [Myxococcales bacterium]